MLHTNILYMMFRLEKPDAEPSLKNLKAHHKLIKSNLMKPAMLNHPSTIWARESQENFEWLYAHGTALCREYDYRYGKEHGSFKRIHQCHDYKETVFSHSFPKEGLSPVTIAMFDEYRIPNTHADHCWEFVIESYRHYYLEGKWRFAGWKKREQPAWWPKFHFAKKYNIKARAWNATNPKYRMNIMAEE